LIEIFEEVRLVWLLVIVEGFGKMGRWRWRWSGGGEIAMCRQLGS